MHNAMKAAKTAPASLELLVDNGKRIVTFQLDYHGGEKYPHLVRDDSKPDLLTEILKAR